MSQSAKEAKTPASDDAMGVGFPSSSSRSGRFASESIGYSSSNRERSISTSSPERISSKSKPSTPSKPPPREHSVENTTIGDAQSGKDFFVSSIDASLFLWNLLWSPNKSTHNEVDLLDTIILQNGVMTSWLFTTKEGEVKSKAKKRWNVNSVVDRLHGPGNGTFGFAFAGGYWSYVTSPDSATNIIQSSSGKAALLSYAHLVPPNFTPSPETPPHSSFLRVDYDYIFNLDQSKAKGNDSGEARMRFWSLCNAQAMGKAQSPTAQVMQKLPADLLVCRNQTLCGLGARALKQFLKIIETDTGRRVTRLSLVFFVQDLVKSASSDDSSRLWLAFAQEVRLVQK